jgi:hypothetical protein
MGVNYGIRLLIYAGICEGGIEQSMSLPQSPNASYKMKILCCIIAVIAISSCVSRDAKEVQFPFSKTYHVKISAAELIETNDSKWLIRFKEGLIRKRTFAIVQSTPELASPVTSGFYEFKILTFFEHHPNKDEIRAIHPVRIRSKYPDTIFIGGTCGINLNIEFLPPK